MDLLENARISLRALEPEDIDILYRWENDSTVWHLSNTLVPFSRFILKQYLENAHRDIFDLRQLRLVIQLKQNHHPIGAIDLFDFEPAHHRAGVGILIADPSDRGKGYAKEALSTLISYGFSILKLHQIWCNVSPGNKASVKLFESAGFKETGRKKDWILGEHGYTDEVIMQLLNTSP